jgi:hypothetical protein
MQTKATCSPADADAMIDQAIMGLLFDSAGPWSDGEVEREIGDRIATTDGLARLHRAGLIHRLDGGFVFPSRAAVHAERVAP